MKGLWSRKQNVPMGCETPACTCRNNLLTSQSSNIPFHVSSHLISPHLFQSHLVSSRLMFSYLLYLFVPLICFTSPRISSHVVSSLLSSSRLIWSRLILFQFINSSHRISSFFNRLNFFSIMSSNFCYSPFHRSSSQRIPVVAADPSLVSGVLWLEGTAPPRQGVQQRS